MNAQTDTAVAPVEWVNVKEASRRFSISRSVLYQLVKEGRIKSVSLTVGGKGRGSRKFSVQSLRELFEDTSQ